MDKFTDISKEKDQINELKNLDIKSEERNNYAEMLLNIVPSAVFSVDNECRIISWNKRAESITGYTSEEVLGQDCKIFALTPCSTKCGLFSSDVKKPITGKVCTIKNKQGDILTISKNVDVLRDSQGTVIGGIECFEDITEKNKIEDTLRESESNFRTFFETVDDMIFVGNSQGVIFYTNGAASRKLGYTQEELQGMHVLDVHPKEKRVEAEQIFGDMFAGRRSSCPLPLAKKDGTFVPVETRVWFGKWDGKDCIFGISKDLSIQQAAFDKFHKLFDNNPELMAVSSILDRKFVEVNTAFLDKLGFLREEIIGKTAEELGLFIENDKQIEAANLLQKEGRIKNIEIKVRKKDGQSMDGLFSGEIIDNQIEKVFLTVMTDITEKKQTEEELTNISNRLKLATKAANMGIWEYDIVNGTLIWDDAMYSLYGITEETFSGAYEAWEQGLHPDDLENSRQHINDAINGVRDFDPEFRVVWPDGLVHHIKANAVVLLDEQGISIKMYGTNVDITERINYEAELIKAKEKAETATVIKSQFLANMSHEIRTPMNGIMGFLQLMQRTDMSDDQKEFIQEAQSASEGLLYVINDILDFSKIEAGKLTMDKIGFRIRTAIEDAVSLLVPKSAEKNIELHTMIKASVPEEVIGDPSRLRQILNNLLSNALKFTESGEVSVTVDCIEEEDEIALIRFEVKDTGIGISQEDIQKLFQSFNQADASTTRKYGGTGLGLAISKELVQMMDGNIHVESIPGEGSTFIFDVRLKISKRASEQKLVFEKLEAVNVLVVDDNTNNRKIVNTYLEEAGCKVFEAKDAVDAMTTIISNSSTKNKISIAVIDYQMPGMSGYEMANSLKTIPFAKDVKLILLSSAAQKGDAKEAKQMGFSGYLTKPVRRDDLVNCIAVVLGLKNEEEKHPIVTKYIVKESIDKNKPKILLVEDNEINRKVIIKMLKMQDMTCDVAVDGKEAYEAVQKKDYDIIFMDCQMPIMDGYESTAEIRKFEDNNKHATIIAMTANALEGDREKCIEAGMDDYISKPIDFEVMFKMIEDNTKNGKIAVDSEQNKGSRFSFSIDLEIVKDVEETIEENYSLALDKNVILVTHDIEIKDIIINYLTPQGVQIEYFDKSVDAFSKIVSQKEKLKNSVILIDASMAGMNGAEFTKAMKAINFENEIPVIIISDINEKNQIIKHYGKNFAMFLLKPIEIKMIKEVITQIQEKNV